MLAGAGKLERRTSAAGPRRVLILTAAMGEGHNAAARAIAEAAARVWPASTVRTVDTLDLMGPGVGSASRGVYRAVLAEAPAVYGFFYAALSASPGFAAFAKRLVGGLSGRRMARAIWEFAPDLVVSTYPVASAGLDWLRERHGMPAAPVVAVVTDFAPHPFWLYAGLDEHLVMHPVALERARALVGAAPARVGALPVRREFGSPDPRAARRRLGLREDGQIVLVTTGAWGIGAVERVVGELLLAAEARQVVVVCGRNRPLFDRLRELAPPRRLVVLGWVDSMPELMAAADVVLTNAGGVSALEAVAAGRPLLIFEPLAGHGRANAELLARAGLAVVCATPAAVRAALDGPAGAATPGFEPRRALDGQAVTAAARTAPAPGGPRSPAPATPLDDDLRALGRLERPRVRPAVRGGRGRRLDPEDAFFVHADTPEVPQQVGGFGILDQRGCPGGELDHGALTAAIGERFAGLPRLGRRLVERPGQALRWAAEEGFDPAWHVRRSIAPAPGDRAALLDAVQRIYAAPLDRGRPLWEIHLIQGLADGRAGLLVKFHHAVADGIATIAMAQALLDPTPGALDPTPASVSGLSAAPPAEPGAGPTGTAPVLRQPAGVALRHAVRFGRGLADLALAGHAPRTPLNRPLTLDRRVATADVALDEVRRLARATGASTHEVALTALAEALRGVLARRGEVPATLRAVVPVATGRRTRWDPAGNRMGGLFIRLPVGEMPSRERLTRVHAEVERRRRSGQPEASTLVMRGAARVMPARWHRGFARFAYQGSWFNLIASTIPGPRVPMRLLGAEIVAAYPLLPLAPEVGLAVGALRWNDRLGFGLTAEAATLPELDELAAGITAAFGGLAAG